MSELYRKPGKEGGGGGAGGRWGRLRWGRGDVDPYGCKEDLKKISYVIGLGVNNRGVLMFLISWIEGERERGGERACERTRPRNTEGEQARERDTHLVVLKFTKFCTTN